MKGSETPVPSLTLDRWHEQMPARRSHPRWHESYSRGRADEGLVGRAIASVFKLLNDRVKKTPRFRKHLVVFPAIFFPP